MILQRQRKVLSQRLKVPPTVNQFKNTLEKNQAAELFRLLAKYAPETAAEKKARLAAKAKAEAEGKPAEEKRAPFVVKYGLDNFVVLLDHNGLQIDGTNDQVMPVGDPCAKFAAFGFETVKVDGHDIQAIVDAIQAPVTPGKPRFICCETVKGKGVSFMENVVGWHGKAPNKEEYIKAMKELGVEVDG